MRTSLLVALILVSGASRITAQSSGEPPLRVVSAHPEEFPETFTSIRSLVALRPGVLVISDTRERRIALVDFARGRFVLLARVGKGPREFQLPGGVTHARGGGAMVFDQPQQRFLSISASGDVLDVVPVPSAMTGQATLDGNSDQFVPDTIGGLHSPGRFNGPRQAMDTLPLLRLRSDGTVVDTTNLLMQQEFRSVPGPNPRMSLGLLVGFSPQDLWAVAPDGRVAVVRADPYRVEWYPASGATVRGPVIPYQPLPVTLADKEAARAQFRSAPPPRITSSSGESQTMQPPVFDPPLRDAKPPFLPQILRIDEQGRLWVERSAAASSTTRSYDVFDRRGVRIDRVELPAGSRLVGFDARSLYAVRVDEDDLQHLQRFTLPVR